MDIELTEAWLCDETGLSREVLRCAREKNLAAADWHKGPRGMIVWELEAVEKILTDLPELAAILKKIKGGGELDERMLETLQPVAATMARKFKNTRLIAATLADGAVIRVKVRDSKNFTKGMRIQVLPSKVKNMPWKLEGRCPRWPGRF